jgi:hypothetical protein
VQEANTDTLNNPATRPNVIFLAAGKQKRSGIPTHQNGIRSASSKMAEQRQAAT